MLVSQIKPCMSHYKLLHGEAANSSLKQLSFIWWPFNTGEAMHFTTGWYFRKREHRERDWAQQITEWVLRITDRIENGQSMMCNGGTNHGSHGAHARGPVLCFKISHSTFIVVPLSTHARARTAHMHRHMHTCLAHKACIGTYAPAHAYFYPQRERER